MARAGLLPGRKVRRGAEIRQCHIDIPVARPVISGNQFPQGAREISMKAINRCTRGAVLVWPNANLNDMGAQKER
jgi:hypothetical protein